MVLITAGEGFNVGFVPSGAGDESGAAVLGRFVENVCAGAIRVMSIPLDVVMAAHGLVEHGVRTATEIPRPATRIVSALRQAAAVINTANIDTLLRSAMTDIELMWAAMRNVRPTARVPSYTPLAFQLTKQYLVDISPLAPAVSLTTRTEVGADVVAAARRGLAFPTTADAAGLVLKLPYSSTGSGVFVVRPWPRDLPTTQDAREAQVQAAAAWLGANLRGRTYFYTQQYFEHVFELRCIVMRGAVVGAFGTKLDTGREDEDEDVLALQQGVVNPSAKGVALTEYSLEELRAPRAGGPLLSDAAWAEARRVTDLVLDRLAALYPGVCGAIRTWPFVRMDFFVTRAGQVRFNELELGSADVAPAEVPRILQTLAVQLANTELRARVAGLPSAAELETRAAAL